MVAKRINDRWTKAEYNKAIDEFVAWRNSKVGEEETIGLEPTRPMQYPLSRKIVSEDSIRAWANAIGDPNPLWRSSAYGKSSRWGAMLLPPTGEAILRDQPGWPPFPQVPGWQQHPLGIDHRYFVPIRAGDEFTAYDKELGIQEVPKEPGLPHRMFESAMSRTYINQRGEVACICVMNLNSVARFPGEEEPIPDLPIYHCSRKELDRIHKAYDDELEGKYRQGKKIRYWEDTKVGEKLHTVVKGPLDITDTCAAVAAMGGIAAYALKWRSIREYLVGSSVDHYTNPDTGEEMLRINRHHDDGAARTMDHVPRWYGYAIQMHGNLAHCITNWMGDDAFVTRFYDRRAARQSNTYHGDLAFINGKVVKKYIDNGEHLVDLEVWDDDQYGNRKRNCKATVRLIAKSGTLTYER